MFTGAFIRDAAERAIKTFAQTLLAALIASGTDLLAAPWWASLSAAGMAAVVSLLTSVVSSYRGDPETASTLTSVVAAPVGALERSVADHPAGRDNAAGDAPVQPWDRDA